MYSLLTLVLLCFMYAISSNIMLFHSDFHFQPLSIVSFLEGRELLQLSEMSN